MNEQLSPILRYTQLLHEFGTEHHQARDFYNANKKDKDFARRAEVIHKLMKAKSVPLGSASAR